MRQLLSAKAANSANAAFLVELLKLTHKMPDPLLCTLAIRFTDIIVKIASGTVTSPMSLDLADKAKTSLVVFLATCCKQR